MTAVKTIARLAAAAALLALAAPLAFAAEPAKAPAPKRPFEQIKYPKLHPITMPDVVRETLPNGMKLILVEDHELPLIQMRAMVRGGRLAEPKGKPGLCDLLSEVHRSGGVRSMTGDQTDDFLERIGASIESSVSDAYGTLSAKALKDQFDKVLPLYAEYLAAPAFSQDKVDLGKTHLASAISRRNDEVMGIARREFMKLVYGAKSPYARQFEYDDVEGLTREDLLAYYIANYRPDQTIMAVWGDFKAAEMKEAISKALGGWSVPGPARPTVEPPIPAPAASVNYVEKKDVEQTTVLMGELGMRLDDPDYPAINLMIDILAAGGSSRIFTQVRTLKGLAYGAGGTMMPAYDHPGAFFFYTATKPHSTAEAIQTMLDEIGKIRKDLVTEQELAQAKDGYLNGYAFEFDSTEKIVGRLLTYEFYGYPADFNATLRDAVEKVTREDILKAARKHLNPDTLSLLAVGNASLFDKPLSTFGAVKTLDITIPEPKPTEIIPEPTPETLKAGTDLLIQAARTVGEPALRGLKTLTSEGTTTLKTPMGEMELKGTTTFILPGRLCAEMTTPMGAMVQVLDGEKAWMKMGTMVRDLPGSAVAEMKKDLYTEAGCALMLKQALEGRLQGQLIGKTQFEGRDASDVLVKVEGSVLRVYVGADGAVLGTRQRAQTKEGPADVIETYGAVQPVKGLLVPFETAQKVKGEVKSASKLTSVKVNEGFSEDLFKKPEAESEKR